MKYLDDLDNGITVMVRIPGTVPREADIDATKLVIYCYITTERIGNANMRGQIAKVVQTFAEGIACAHLNKLRKFYVARKEDLTTHELPKSVKAEDPLIPNAEDSHPCFYKFVGMPPGALNTRLNAIDDAEFDSIERDIDWAAVKDAADFAEKTLKQSAPVDICACCFCLLSRLDLRRYLKWRTDSSIKNSDKPVRRLVRKFCLGVKCSD